MRAVNLLPNETGGGRRGIDRVLFVALAVTALVVAALAGGFVLEKARAGTQQKRQVAAQAALDRMRSQVTSNDSPAPARLQIPVVLSQEEPWHVALDAALSTRVSWDVLLSQLEYVVPDRISLTTVALGGSGGTAGATTGTITLGGTSFSSGDIAVFLSNLARVPNVSKVTLVSSARNSQSNVRTFQVTAEMALPAALTAPAPETTTTTGG